MARGLPTRPQKILILYNESPDWPESDKVWTQNMMAHLTEALQQKGFEHDSLKIYDSLNGLDGYDPAEWLIWNWAEELGGKPWTDAVVVDELVRRGYAYTGSPASALALSCERLKIKEVLRAAGVPCLPARVLTDPAQAPDWQTFPAIVKGAHQHGSFGIDQQSVVFNTAELADRVAYMRTALNDDSLVEPFLDTREFHVSIIGNGRHEILPPAELIFSAFDDMRERLYMFQWKFVDESIGYKLIKPSPLPPDAEPELQDRLRRAALKAYRAVGLADYGRVDLRLLGDEPQVLDVNPNPDLDMTSALIISAAAAGIPYADVVERIILAAAERHARTAR